MAMTFDEMQALLEAGGLKIKREHDRIFLSFQTKTYCDRDGDKSVILVIRLDENGEYFKVFAPHAFNVKGPHADAALRACAMIQWQTKMVQFEYDDSDGEIRPIVEFPLEDNKLTDRQLRRCIAALVGLLDHYYPALKNVIDTGIIDFGDKPAGEREGQIQALRRIIRDMEQAGAPAEQVATLRATLAQLETTPTEI